MWGGGGLHIFIFRVFLSFKAVASVDYISFSGGEVQAGGGGGVGDGQCQFDYFSAGGGRI